MKIIVVRMSGGLGNQLFQLSAAIYLAREHKNSSIYFDDRFINKYETSRFREFDFILNCFDEINVVLKVSKLFLVASRYRIARIFDFLFSRYGFIGSSKKIIKSKKYEIESVLLDGYFQDPNLVFTKADNQKIFSSLAVNYDHLKSIFSEFNQIQKIGVHIRRGDYVSSKAAASVFRTIEIEYYREAVKKFPINSKFYIFGDDPEVTKMFAAEVNGVDVSALKFSLQEDFVALAMCDHYIIANSTFSWWASYIGGSANKRIIAPKNWYVDENRSALNPLLLSNFELIDN